jgi:hypothetical protein
MAAHLASVIWGMILEQGSASAFIVKFCHHRSLTDIVTPKRLGSCRQAILLKKESKDI